jgi:hypothetical protein
LRLDAKIEKNLYTATCRKIEASRKRIDLTAFCPTAMVEPTKLEVDEIMFGSTAACWLIYDNPTISKVHSYRSLYIK